MRRNVVVLNRKIIAKAIIIITTTKKTQGKEIQRHFLAKYYQDAVKYIFILLCIPHFHMTSKNLDLTIIFNYV